MGRQGRTAPLKGREITQSLLHTWLGLLTQHRSLRSSGTSLIHYLIIEQLHTYNLSTQLTEEGKLSSRSAWATLQPCLKNNDNRSNFVTDTTKKDKYHKPILQCSCVPTKYKTRIDPKTMAGWGGEVPSRKCPTHARWDQLGFQGKQH